jgi:ribosomal protein L35AE/L33A
VGALEKESELCTSFVFFLFFLRSLISLCSGACAFCFLPQVYVVRTNGTGKEREAVLTLMNKMLHLAKVSGRPSKVTSVFTNGSKGVVYIESKSEVHAKALVEGMKLLKAYTFKLVR